MRLFSTLSFLALLGGCSDPAPVAERSCFDWTATGAATAELLRSGYQGGGPSFAAVLRARLEEESPEALSLLELDDEGDALRVCSSDSSALLTARNAAGRMDRDVALLHASIARAVSAGEME